jgi:hypothetical protein
MTAARRLQHIAATPLWAWCNDLEIEGASRKPTPRGPTEVNPSKLHKNKEPTSGLEPLTCSLRVRKRKLLSITDGCETCILSRFLFSRLPCVAGCCASGSVRVVSEAGACPSPPFRQKRRKRKPGEREIYNPEVALVALVHLALNLLCCDPSQGKQKYPCCILDDRYTSR